MCFSWLSFNTEKGEPYFFSGLPSEYPCDSKLSPPNPPIQKLLLSVDIDCCSWKNSRSIVSAANAGLHPTPSSVKCKEKEKLAHNWHKILYSPSQGGNFQIVYFR